MNSRTLGGQQRHLATTERHLATTQQLLLRTQQRLAHTQRSLSRTQHTLSVVTKQSTATRVITVTQRCTLTSLIILRLILHRGNPGAIPPFEASLTGCLKQLKSVRSINAHTPNVT